MVKKTWAQVAARANALLRQNEAVVVAPGIGETPALHKTQLKKFYRYLNDSLYKAPYQVNGDVKFIVLSNDVAEGFARVTDLLRLVARDSAAPDKVQQDLETLRLVANAQHELNIPPVDLLVQKS
jgi:hypothetical protein